MDGVTIIEECRSLPFGIGIIIIIIVLLIGTVGLKVFDWFYDEDNVIGMIITAAIVLTSVVSPLYLVNKIEAFTEPNGKLRVVVSDTVDMNAFQEKYEIINFENGVYTVKPKDCVPQPSLNTHKETTEEATTKIDGKIYKITQIE